MKKIEEIISLLKSNHKLFEQYGVDLIGIFGSYVRNDYNEHSDLDILINPNGEKPFGLFSLVNLEEDLNDLLGIRVDLSIKRSLKPIIGKYILKELVKIND